MAGFHYLKTGFPYRIIKLIKAKFQLLFNSSKVKTNIVIFLFQRQLSPRILNFRKTFLIGEAVTNVKKYIRFSKCQIKQFVSFSIKNEDLLVLKIKNSFLKTITNPTALGFKVEY